MFNIWLGFYIIAALAIIGGGTMKINNLNQPIGAGIFFFGALAAFIVYGMRWFDSSSGILSKTPGQWPPTLNTCPDYLTYFSRKKTGGKAQDTCIDFIGVSTNATLKVFPPDGVQNPPSDEGFYFPLGTTSSDPVKKNNELCQRAMTYGLSWEGITNGESCTGPDGTPSNANGGAAKDACPATVATPKISG